MTDELWSEFAVVIQARMGSTRLPGKTLLPLGGSTVLGFLVERLIKSGIPQSSIIIATSDLVGDQEIVNYAKKLNVSCYIGSEKNVLQRYIDVAKIINSKFIIRITGDNPFINMGLLKSVALKHLFAGKEFTSTRLIEDGKIFRYMPKGSSVDIFSRELLLSIKLDDCSDFDKEHVIPCFYRFGSFCLYKEQDALESGIEVEKDSSVSIDTKEDYICAKQLLERGFLND